MQCNFPGCSWSPPRRCSAKKRRDKILAHKRLEHDGKLFPGMDIGTGETA